MKNTKVLTMTKEAKRMVAALRVVCDERSCEGCPCSDWCYKRKVNCLDDDAADLIESLSEQLDQVTRERDALVEEIAHYCGNCKYADNEYGEEPCPPQAEYSEPCQNWQWRGVEVEG